MKDLNLIKEYAIKSHGDCNCVYDGKPYSLHLELVYNVALKFIHLIPEDKREVVLAGCWVHDLIEDARQTYNDVKKVCGLEVAELAYALTNEKGKTRKERANDKYYEGIRNTPYATFIKLCDRIANYDYSCAKGSSMGKKYKEEMPDFVSKLYDEKYQEMFDYLNS